MEVVPYRPLSERSLSSKCHAVLAKIHAGDDLDQEDEEFMELIQQILAIHKPVRPTSNFHRGGSA